MGLILPFSLYLQHDFHSESFNIHKINLNYSNNIHINSCSGQSGTGSLEDYSEPDDFQSEGDNNYCQVLSYLGSSPRCRLDLTELSDTNQQEIPLSSAPVFIFEKLFSPKKFKVIAQLLN